MVFILHRAHLQRFSISISAAGFMSSQCAAEHWSMAFTKGLMWYKHWMAAFIKHVLPKLFRPIEVKWRCWLCCCCYDRGRDCCWGCRCSSCACPCWRDFRCVCTCCCGCGSSCCSFNCFSLFSLLDLIDFDVFEFSSAFLFFFYSICIKHCEFNYIDQPVMEWNWVLWIFLGGDIIEFLVVLSDWEPTIGLGNATLLSIFGLWLIWIWSTPIPFVLLVDICFLERRAPAQPRKVWWRISIFNGNRHSLLTLLFNI